MKMIPQAVVLTVLTTSLTAFAQAHGRCNSGPQIAFEPLVLPKVSIVTPDPVQQTRAAPRGIPLSQRLNESAR